MLDDDLNFEPSKCQNAFKTSKLNGYSYSIKNNQSEMLMMDVVPNLPCLLMYIHTSDKTTTKACMQKKPHGGNRSVFGTKNWQINIKKQQTFELFSTSRSNQRMLKLASGFYEKFKMSWKLFCHKITSATDIGTQQQVLLYFGLILN
jgi:hypothetical protein